MCSEVYQDLFQGFSQLFQAPARFWLRLRQHQLEFCSAPRRRGCEAQVLLVPPRSYPVPESTAVPVAMDDHVGTSAYLYGVVVSIVGRLPKINHGLLSGVHLG